MTDSADITPRLTRVFREVFDEDALVLTPAMTADDIDEWDSLSHIRLMLSVEKEFGVKFSATEIGALKNVGDFLALIARKL